jgi:hippurate hydrolase
MPHETRDPVVAALGLGTALQTVVSRNHRATDDLVLSVTQVHAGSANNVIPGEARLSGTVRSFDPAVRDMAERRIRAIGAGVAATYDVAVDLHYHRGYPATVNDPDLAGFAAAVARDVVGADRVDAAVMREMGAEDFAYMLEARPGAYLFLGAGEDAGLHHPEYDFNGRIAPVGAAFFARMVEMAQPV